MDNTIISIIGGAVAAHAVGTLGLGIALAKTRERVVRLEEWIRIHNGKDEKQ